MSGGLHPLGAIWIRSGPGGDAAGGIGAGGDGERLATENIGAGSEAVDGGVRAGSGDGGNPGGGDGLGLLFVAPQPSF